MRAWAEAQSGGTIASSGHHHLQGNGRHYHSVCRVTRLCYGIRNGMAKSGTHTTCMAEFGHSALYSLSFLCSYPPPMHRISDQGGGICEEQFPHVFDYAFTTAPVCFCASHLPLVCCALNLTYGTWVQEHRQQYEEGGLTLINQSRCVVGCGCRCFELIGSQHDLVYIVLKIRPCPFTPTLFFVRIRKNKKYWPTTVS